MTQHTLFRNLSVVMACSIAASAMAEAGETEFHLQGSSIEGATTAGPIREMVKLVPLGEGRVEITRQVQRPNGAKVVRTFHGIQRGNEVVAVITQWKGLTAALSGGGPTPRQQQWRMQVNGEQVTAQLIEGQRTIASTAGTLHEMPDFLAAEAGRLREIRGTLRLDRTPKKSQILVLEMGGRALELHRPKSEELVRQIRELAVRSKTERVEVLIKGIERRGPRRAAVFVKSIEEILPVEPVPGMPRVEQVQQLGYVKPLKLSFQANYVQVRGLENAALEATINRALMGHMRRALESAKANVREIGDLAGQSDGGYGSDFWGTMAAGTVTKRLLSVRGSTSSYVVRTAHPNHGFLAANFDLETGRRLSTADFLKNGARDLPWLAKQVTQRLHQNPSFAPGGDYELEGPTADQLGKVVIEDSKMVFLLDHYPHVYGPVTAEIPLRELSERLDLTGPLGSAVRR